MANPIKMDSFWQNNKSKCPLTTVICHAWNAGKTEIGVLWKFLLRRPTSFPPGPKTTKPFSDSALFRYSLATKIKARCAGRSLMWIHVGYLCVWRRKAALSTAIALQTDFPFQAVYKERFNPSVLTKCTNITDTARAELGRTSARCGGVWPRPFSAIFSKIQKFAAKVACLDIKVD